MRDIILCLKAGTQEHEVFAFDRQLQPVAHTRCLLQPQSPRSGWVELPADDIWTRLRDAARKMVAEIGLERIAGIGVACERDTVVVWERATGRPLYPAILPDDHRTQDICLQLKQQRKEPMLHYRTGLFLLPNFPATKISWILDHVEQARDRAYRGELACGTLETWILWNLTGGKLHGADAGNASRTLFYDLGTRQWEPQLLATFGIPASLLPRLMPSSGMLGDTDRDVFGLPLPILALAADEQAGLFAQTAFSHDIARVYYGQHLLFLAPLGADLLIPPGLFCQAGWTINEVTEFTLEVKVPVGAAAIEWLQHGLDLLPEPAASEALARSVADTGGVYFVPALEGLGLPYFDPSARGLIIGLNPQTRRPHIIRAVLESLAHQTADIVHAVATVAKKRILKIRADGAAARNDFLLQFQADLLGLEVERPKMLNTPALGAARLAGMAAGWFPAGDQFASEMIECVFKPSMPDEQRKALRACWLDAVERSLNWERRIKKNNISSS